MRKINVENRKRVNSIYGQCVIYSLIIGALGVPFLIPAKAKLPKRSFINNPMAVTIVNAQAQIQAPYAMASAQASIQDKIAHQVISAEAQIKAGISMLHAQAILQPKITIPVETKTLVPVAVKKLQKNSVKILIQHTQVDHVFLSKMEGSILKGYVPLPKTTQSGVTIASGFDLGQLSLQAFNKLPINDALKDKLRPYVGLKKFAAVDFLKTRPLTINHSEMKELNNVAANMILQPLAKSYDKASKTPFTKLPPQAQTALFSFAYQYGAGFMYKSGTRQLWDYYVDQNWSKVSKTLRSFKMYAPRRHQEAKLINHLAYSDSNIR